MTRRSKEQPPKPQGAEERQLEFAAVRALERLSKPHTYKDDALAIKNVLVRYHGDSALKVAQEVVGLLARFDRPATEDGESARVVKAELDSLHGKAT